MAGKNEVRLAVLEGDGIGPEITDATVTVLKAAARRAGLGLRIRTATIGWKAYRKSRSTLPDATLKALDAHEGWIVGPTFAGEYPKDDPYRGHPNGFIRRHYKLFANVRPVQAWPQLNPLIPDVDVTVLRENTEGFYPDRNLAWGYGEFKPREDVGLALRVITGEACDRFAKFCLDYAVALGEKRLAIVHKRTVLPQTDGIFIGAFEKIRHRFRGIELELVRIDTFSSTFPREPHRYKIVATTNLFGDILSDQASGLAGGVGLAPSLNAGIEHAMAQAVHGTAPDIAGKQRANPSALILSTAMLLRWFYLRNRSRACREAAAVMERAVKKTILSGDTTPDLGGGLSTSGFTKSVVASMD
jgi:isocitrate/isopropylmalate dehydrogenase